MACSSLLRIAAHKQQEINETIRKEHPHWPADPPVMRVFEGMCEIFFPSEGPGVDVPLPARISHAWGVLRRARPGVFAS